MTGRSIEILLVIETEFATTRFIEQILKACEVHGVHARTCFLDNLTPAHFGPQIIPLFVRCGDPTSRVWTSALAEAGRTYVYYIDDNFWRIVGTTALARYYRHSSVRRALESNVARAHTVIAGSSELARFVSRFNRRVVVLPALIDFSLIAAGPTPDITSEIRIGFAGSPSRGSDLDLISPILSRILEKHPRVVFEFVGAFPKGLAESDRVRRFPHLDGYEDYVRWQSSRGWAIGLAPLIDHEANRSKTDNKYREYAAFGYAGIYSAIPPYTEVLNHGSTGLLVENTTDAWFEALDELLTDAPKRQAIARQASADVRARYDITQVSEVWSRLFRDIGAELPADAHPIDERRLRRDLRKAFVDRWRVRVAVKYAEGGLPLVAERTFRKIVRWVSPRN